VALPPRLHLATVHSLHIDRDGVLLLASVVSAPPGFDTAVQASVMQQILVGSASKLDLGKS
jgi:hypothetical protein